MVEVKEDGWLERAYKGKGKAGQDWWIIKHASSRSYQGYINLRFPKEWIGKKVRIKIEEVSDEK